MSQKPADASADGDNPGPTSVIGQDNETEVAENDSNNQDVLSYQGQYVSFEVKNPSPSGSPAGDNESLPGAGEIPRDEDLNLTSREDRVIQQTTDILLNSTISKESERQSEVAESDKMQTDMNQIVDSSDREQSVITDTGLRVVIGSDHGEENVGRIESVLDIGDVGRDVEMMQTETDSHEPHSNFSDSVAMQTDEPVSDNVEIEMKESSVSENVKLQTEESSVSDNFNIQTKQTKEPDDDVELPTEEAAVIDNVELHTEEPAVSDNVELQTKIPAVSDNIELQTEEPAFSENVELQTKESTVSDNVELQTKEPAVSDNVELQTKIPAVSDNIELQTEEPAFSENVELQTKESTVSDNVELQTKEPAVSDNVELQTKIPAVSDNIELQTEEPAFSENVELQTKELAVCDVELQTQEPAVSDNVELQTKEPAVSDNVELQTKIPAVSDNIELQTKEPAVSDNVELQTKIPAVSDNIELQTKEPAVSDVELQTKEPAVNDNVELQTKEPAVSDNVELQTKEPAVSDNVELHTKEPAVSDNVELQSEVPADSDNVKLRTQEPAVSDNVDLQTEESAVSDNVETEEQAVSDNIELQTKEPAVSDNVELQTKEPAVSDVELQTKEPAVNDNVELQTKEPAVSDVELQTKEPAVNDNVELQTKEPTVSDNVELQTKEPAVSDNVELQTKEPAVSDNVELQTKEPAVSDNVELQTKERAVSDNVELQTKERAVSDNVELQTEEHDVSNNVELQTKEPSVRYNVETQSKETILNDNVDIQSKEPSVSDNVEIVTMDASVSENVEIPARKPASEELILETNELSACDLADIPTKESSVSDNLAFQTKEPFTSESVEIQVEEPPITDSVDIQMEEPSVGMVNGVVELHSKEESAFDNVKIQTEELADMDFAEIQTKECVEVREDQVMHDDNVLKAVGLVHSAEQTQNVTKVLDMTDGTLKKSDEGDRIMEQVQEEDKYPTNSSDIPRKLDDDSHGSIANVENHVKECEKLNECGSLNPADSKNDILNDKNETTATCISAITMQEDCMDEKKENFDKTLLLDTEENNVTICEQDSTCESVKVKDGGDPQECIEIFSTDQTKCFNSDDSNEMDTFVDEHEGNKTRKFSCEESVEMNSSALSSESLDKFADNVLEKTGEILSSSFDLEKLDEPIKSLGDPDVSAVVECDRMPEVGDVVKIKQGIDDNAMVVDNAVVVTENLCSQRLVAESAGIGMDSPTTDIICNETDKVCVVDDGPDIGEDVKLCDISMSQSECTVIKDSTDEVYEISEASGSSNMMEDSEEIPISYIEITEEDGKVGKVCALSDDNDPVTISDTEDEPVIVVDKVCKIKEEKPVILSDTDEPVTAVDKEDEDVVIVVDEEKKEPVEPAIVEDKDGQCAERMKDTIAGEAVIDQDGEFAPKYAALSSRMQDDREVCDCMEAILTKLQSGTEVVHLVKSQKANKAVLWEEEHVDMVTEGFDKQLVSVSEETVEQLGRKAEEEMEVAEQIAEGLDVMLENTDGVKSAEGQADMQLVNSCAEASEELQSLQKKTEEQMELEVEKVLEEPVHIPIQAVSGLQLTHERVNNQVSIEQLEVVSGEREQREGKDGIENVPKDINLNEGMEETLSEGSQEGSQGFDYVTSDESKTEDTLQIVNDDSGNDYSAKEGKPSENATNRLNGQIAQRDMASVYDSKELDGCGEQKMEEDGVTCVNEQNSQREDLTDGSTKFCIEKDGAMQEDSSVKQKSVDVQPPSVDTETLSKKQQVRELHTVSNESSNATGSCRIQEIDAQGGIHNEGVLEISTEEEKDANYPKLDVMSDTNVEVETAAVMESRETNGQLAEVGDEERGTTIDDERTDTGLGMATCGEELTVTKEDAIKTTDEANSMEVKEVMVEVVEAEPSAADWRSERVEMTPDDGKVDADFVNTTNGKELTVVVEGVEGMKIPDEVNSVEGREMMAEVGEVEEQLAADVSAEVGIMTVDDGKVDANFEKTTNGEVSAVVVNGVEGKKTPDEVNSMEGRVAMAEVDEAEEQLIVDTRAEDENVDAGLAIGDENEGVETTGEEMEGRVVTVTVSDDEHDEIDEAEDDAMVDMLTQYVVQATEDADQGESFKIANCNTFKLKTRHFSESIFELESLIIMSEVI